KVHYDTYGTKTGRRAVVFLSGAGTDGGLWRNQVAALKEIFFVVTVDLRGLGQSDPPADPCTADQFAADVRAVLAEEGLERASLVGFSLGGLVAQRFLNNYPEALERLILLNCSLGAGNPDTVLPRREVVNMFLFAAALTEEDFCRNSVDYHFGPSYETTDPDGYKAFYDYTGRNIESIPFHLPILVSDEPFIEDPSAVETPVMVILSKDDLVTPPENGAAFLKHLPHARIEYLEGHHASMLIHPGDINRLIADFLA
ncbi:MAG: alpha/beta fold hydrolase, partial [Candidatus Lokiarchaeota archaeon]|nr:alpha/beta fold hydrolase [Candidatus Lokiarchaeota archaeon]